MKRAPGFTLIELLVVVAIAAILGAIFVWSGRSIRQNATLSEGAYDLTLRMSGLRGTAMANGKDYLLVVTDTPNANDCRQTMNACGKWFVLTDIDPAFALNAFNPNPPIAGASIADPRDGGTWDYLPRGSRFDLASAWNAPAPFNGVAAWNPAVRTNCAGGITCFGIRFTAGGEVRPEAAVAPIPAGFAFILAPIDLADSGGDRRGIFVSFPTGMVKTQAF
jgi:prepilin-type N-terminal cleavage/methylation domain-containing protein